MTLTKGTFEAFMQARSSFRDLPASIESATAKEKVLYASRRYLAMRNESFGFDLDTPEGEALARYVCQIRILRPEEIALVEKAFSESLSPETKILLRDMLTMNGYESDGALWVEYGPAAARNIFRKVKEAGLKQLGHQIADGGVSSEDISKRSAQVTVDALMHSMTTMARLRSSARRLRAPGKVVAVTAASVAHIAENDPARILTERIIVTPVGDDEGRAVLEKCPGRLLKRD